MDEMTDDSKDCEPKAPWSRRGIQAAIAGFVVLGLYLLWPIPSGQMPLSADHAVHLTRAWAFSERLAEGELGGWSMMWFFGTPLGEFYPVLGDLFLAAIRWLSFGLFSWPTAYALGFTFLFLFQGFALIRVSRSLGLGALPAFVAAALIVLDPGSYREGGWMYTVYFGVWPQILATSLTWWGFAALADGLRASRERWPRACLEAVVAFGAALLAHPMSILALVMGVPLLPQCLAHKTGLTFRRNLARTAIVSALGFGLAAWWLLPMLDHRAWMASYGWLFRSLSSMFNSVLEGQWTYNMPATVGYCISAGILVTLWRGSSLARFVVLFTLSQWLAAGSDLFWFLRLDRLSEGFTHLQYQRFLIVAKPGFYLCVGLLLQMLLSGRLVPIRKLWPRYLAVAGVLIGLTVHSASTIEHSKLLAKPVIERQADKPESAFLELRAWMAKQSPSDHFAFSSSRQQHWFMDLPVENGRSLYKIGFTPADNFVHKPESGKKEVLDARGIQYTIRSSTGEKAVPREVARFGDLRVQRRKSKSLRPVAWIEGEGQIHWPDGDPPTEKIFEEGLVRLTVELPSQDIKQDTGEAEAPLLVFRTAAYDRWELRLDGELLPWKEIPIWGDEPPLEQGERERRRLRSGKANGDDGSEPILLAASLPHGGDIELRYRRWLPSDYLGTALSLVSLLLCLLLWLPSPLRFPAGRLLRLGGDLLHHLLAPVTIASLVLLTIGGAALRWHDNAQTETLRAVGWVEEGEGKDAKGIRLGAHKTDMLIRPALLARKKGRSQIEFPDRLAEETLYVWAGLDDERSKSPKGRRGYRFILQVRAAEGEWETLINHRVPNLPGRHKFALDTSKWAGERVDLKVQIEGDSRKSSPRLGFDLSFDPLN